MNLEIPNMHSNCGFAVGGNRWGSKEEFETILQKDLDECGVYYVWMIPNSMGNVFKCYRLDPVNMIYDDKQEYDGKSGIYLMLNKKPECCENCGHVKEKDKHHKFDPKWVLTNKVTHEHRIQSTEKAT